MANKASGVLFAMKGRKNIAAKKGGFLLGIIAKLSQKREEAKEKKSGKDNSTEEKADAGMGGSGKKC